MPTHVALPRGINVGGRKRFAMADLREVVLGLGHVEGSHRVDHPPLALLLALASDSVGHRRLEGGARGIDLGRGTLAR